MTNRRPRPAYSAKDRAESRGWMFKTISDVVTMIASRRRFLATVGVRKRTPAEQRAAIEPMRHGARVLAYMAGDPRRPFTARQRRRMVHKNKIGAAAYARGERSQRIA